MAKDDPVIMTGVEMFSEGTWNGIPFTSEDVDSVVAAFDTLGLSGRVPLKLGHEGPDARDLDKVKNPLAQLAFGWVTKVYREGKKLLADWEVPPEVATMIKKGYLRHISVELLKDVQAGTRVIPWVLDAVALLGTDQPAVGILKDLKKVLKMAVDAVTLPHGERLSFSRADDSIHYSGDIHSMSDNNRDAVAELADQIAKLRVELTKKDDTIASLRTEKTGLSEIKTQFTALQEQVQSDKRNTHRKAITDRLEAAVKSEDIQPKIRANFVSVFGVEDDDQVMKVTLEHVEDFIKANPNPYKKRDPSKDKVVSLARATDEVPPGTSAELEVVMRVEAGLREDGVTEFTDMDFEKRVKTMFKLNPALAERYRTGVLNAVNHPAARQ